MTIKNLFAAFVAVLLITGCATVTVPPSALEQPRPGAVLARVALDQATEDRILAIDPMRVSDDDVRGPLSKAPAPRLMLLHGGIYPVHLIMVSFGHFLVGMGYPEGSIRDPGNREWSYSPYEESSVLTGILAWSYEHDGMRPMMIGHSQGGMQAVKVLQQLDGRFGNDVRVYNPWTHQFEERTTIVDTYTGRSRPVHGLSASYASVVGAGGAAYMLPNQWDMIGKMRSIPDTVDEFTGFFIALDLIAWSFPGVNEQDIFREKGTAQVRNLELPATYSHVFLPAVQELAKDPETRARINAYAPGKAGEAGLESDRLTGALWAADVWFSIKKHWVTELQHLIRARRAATATAGDATQALPAAVRPGRPAAAQPAPAQPPSALQPAAPRG